MAGADRAANDPRFSKVFSDPRFRTVRKKDLKVQLDERFNKKNLKNEFSLLKSTAKVDKYGRKIKSDANSVVDNLDKYYNDDEEEVEAEAEAEADEDDDEKNGSDEDEDNESESEASEAELDPLAKARGLVDADSSSDEDDSSDEEVEASAFADENEIYSGDDTDEEQREHIPEQDPTTRIAAVNLDWDHINSKSLYATFSSFLPTDGSGGIKRVTIYKSEYGKQRLADEDLNGPPKEIFKGSAAKAGSDDDDDDDDDEDEDLDLAKASKKLIQENNGEDEGFDSTELRRYQLQRLRYYYAIVEFTNLKSAEEIYSKCDNTEFESSGNFFDLRYVPDGMEFEESDIKDSCDKLPANFEPIEFSTDSLRNSKPKLTWDETPIERVQILSKSFKQGELDDLDLKNYLASDSEDDDELTTGADAINKYKSLVAATGLSKRKSTNDGEDAGEGSDEDDVDMEFTFTPGLGSKEQAKKDKEAEQITAIEKLRLKEQERRRARKQKVKELKREAQSKKGRRVKRDENVEEEELKIEEIGDGHGNGNGSNAELSHFNIKDVEKLEKLKSKKSKFKNKRQRELEKELETRVGAVQQEQGALEIDDRFSEMLDSHAFVGGSNLLQQERKRRKKQSKEKK